MNTRRSNLLIEQYLTLNDVDLLFVIHYDVYFKKQQTNQSDYPFPLILTLIRVKQVSTGGHLHTTFTSDQSKKGFHSFRKYFELFTIR